MKLLLHTCCAPCLIYPLETLKSKGFEVQGLFYNPNIYPQEEYEKRKTALEKYSKIANVEIIYPGYAPEEYFNSVSLNAVSLEADSIKAPNLKRCLLCWSLRLKKVAQIAKEMGLDAFSTTLLVSPYQNQEEIKKIGEDISKEAGIDFYFEDFRTGFRRALDDARAQGIYCQKYCGCVFSRREA